MPAKTLLVEIGTEELPPKSLNRLRNALAEGLSAELAREELRHGNVSAYATPRRLAVVVEKLKDRQPDQQVEKRGPARQASFTEDDQPTKALKGFMRGCGIEDPEHLDIIDTDKGEYMVFRQTREGKSIDDLLPAMLENALSALPVERRMRWGKRREEFVRPVSWVVCLFGSRVPEVSIMGCRAGNMSRGHRFMSQGAFEITGADAYVDACRANHVLVDFDGRMEMIRSQVESVAAAEGGILEMDEALLEEVTSLVEWPVALAGEFDQAFLTVPPEALISAMKSHQRYFHLLDRDGRLLPRFITVSNIESRDPAVVITGNERVIAPRLADASFFYEQDTRSSLESKVDRLAAVVFQTELGSYLDKTHRVSALAGFIAECMDQDSAQARRAGYLCKADLVSDMVDEFPDLQGTMGGYYARHDNESDEVARGIEQHYRPSQSGGLLPDNGVASCVALADKIDTLVGLFGINQPPTGSRDPFALRRQALGVIRICVENHLDLQLMQCLEKSASLYDRSFTVDHVSRYIIERLSGYYADQGISPDVVEAATHGSLSGLNLLELDDVIKTLQVFRSGPAAEQIVAANKRVANLLKKSGGAVTNDFDKGLADQEAELALFEAMKGLTLDDVRGAGARLEQLAVLQTPVDRFFDEVLVMAEDPAVRDNRLALLGQLRAAFLKVADFSLLQ